MTGAPLPQSAANQANANILEVYDRNQEATIYVGNLDQKVDDALLWELFVQCGPIQSVHLPKDKISNIHQGYSFVEFKTEEDSDYACKIMNMVKLFGKPIRTTKATQDLRKMGGTGGGANGNNQTSDIGANLFIGNLDPSCDDKILIDTFSSFGQIIFAKVMRDPDTGLSREFGFVSFDSFESSDAAMVALNGQFLCNSVIQVSYAYKKDTKGERHGAASERLIADRLIDQKREQRMEVSNAVGMQPGGPNGGNLPGQGGPPSLPGLGPPQPVQMLPQGQGLAIPTGPAPPILRGGPMGGSGQYGTQNNNNMNNMGNNYDPNNPLPPPPASVMPNTYGMGVQPPSGPPVLPGQRGGGIKGPNNQWGKGGGGPGKGW